MIDTHVPCDVVENRCRHYRPVNLASGHQLSAPSYRLLHERIDLLCSLGADERSEHDIAVARIAGRQQFGLPAEPCDEIVSDDAADARGAGEIDAAYRWMRDECLDYLSCVSRRVADHVDHARREAGVAENSAQPILGAGTQFRCLGLSRYG